MLDPEEVDDDELVLEELDELFEDLVTWLVVVPSPPPAEVEALFAELAMVADVPLVVRAWASGIWETTSAITPAPMMAAIVRVRLTRDRRRSAASLEFCARVLMTSSVVVEEEWVRSGRGPGVHVGEEQNSQHQTGSQRGDHGDAPAARPGVEAAPGPTL